MRENKLEQVLFEYKNTCKSKRKLNFVVSEEIQLVPVVIEKEKGYYLIKLDKTNPINLQRKYLAMAVSYIDLFPKISNVIDKLHIEENMFVVNQLKVTFDQLCKINNLALELLIPDEKIKVYLKNNSVEVNKKMIAEQFNVTEHVANIKLIQLGLINL